MAIRIKNEIERATDGVVDIGMPGKLAYSASAEHSPFAGFS